MSLLLYVFASVGWSAIGFVFGVLTIRSAYRLGLVAGAVTMEDPMAVLPEKPQPRQPRLIGGRFRIVNVAVGALLVLIGVFSAVSGLVLEKRTAAVIEQNASQDVLDRELLRCQQAYANGFADALEARTAPAVEAQTALYSWMKIVRDVIAAPAVDQQGQAAALERFQQATTEYLDKLEKLQKQQIQNPYPPPPREC